MKLKGYVLTINYSTGMREVERYDIDELGTLDDKLTGLMITSLEDIQSYTVEKEWVS